MMNKVKKLFQRKLLVKEFMGVCLVMAMVLSMGGNVSRVKADTNTLTIQGKTSAEGLANNYRAYQILTGTVDESSDIKKLQNPRWTTKISYEEINKFIDKLQSTQDFVKNGTNLFQSVTKLANDTPDYPDNISSAKSFQDALKTDEFQSLSASTLNTFSEIVAEYFTKATDGNSWGSAQSKTDKSLYTISGLPDGYYVVKDDARSDKSLARTRYILTVVGGTDNTVKTKASETVVEKKVSNEKEDNYDKAVSSTVGDPVYFKLIAKLPEYIKNYKTYKLVFHDTLTKGLTYEDIESVRYITEDGDVTDIKDYTVKVENETTNGGTNLTISTKDLKPDFPKMVYGDEVEVIYRAKLNDNAVIGEAGNPNTVYLNYTNDPYVDAANDDAPGKTPEDKAIVFTYELDATKVDGSDTSTPQRTLEGASFFVYRYNDAAEKCYLVEKTEHGKVNKWMSESDIAESGRTVEEMAVPFTSDENGQFSIKGLGAGTYYLEEIKAPDGGYKLLKDPVEFKIEDTLSQTTMTLESLGISVDGGKLAEGVKTTGLVSMTVENKRGSELPTTGGIGTRIFYLLGGILVLGAVILLITKKRTGSEA